MPSILRPLDAIPVQTSEGLRVLIRDPIGVIPSQLVLTPELYWIACQLDGSEDPAELAASMKPQAGEVRPEIVEEALRALDEHLLLDNGRFRAARDELFEAFRRERVRPMLHANGNYPLETSACAAFLNELFDEAGEPGELTPEGLRGVVAPHIDLERGRPTYARTYGPLQGLARKPQRVVILGTCHAPMEARFALTRKGFETPLGLLENDTSAVDRLAEAVGGDPFREEYYHRIEHSIEFQTVFAKHLFPEARVVPVLVGSLLNRRSPERPPGDQPAIARLIAGLQALMDPLTLIIAGIDLAHVGPRFGRPPQLDPAYLEQVESEDRGSLDAACELDAEGFWRSVAAGGDPRQVCGLSPLFLFLKVLQSSSPAPPRGTLIQYRQCVSEDQCVSIAGLWFR